ncbi:ATP-binding protein [Streptomyces physcomitrii]|uniref:ATP-binding protein n=1 Tax=Streptomyces physcomitrii TaxID=2724184 RepID=UPI0033EB7A13
MTGERMCTGEVTVVPQRGRAVPASAAEARQEVEFLLYDRYLTGSAAARQSSTDALLVTSELVTNALVHGGGLTGFRAELVPGGLRLTAQDRSAELPRLRSEPRDLLPGGYGWPLIHRLAQEITLRLLPGGGKQISLFLPLD